MQSNTKSRPKVYHLSFLLVRILTPIISALIIRFISDPVLIVSLIGVDIFAAVVIELSLRKQVKNLQVLELENRTDWLKQQIIQSESLRSFIIDRTDKIHAYLKTKDIEYVIKAFNTAAIVRETLATIAGLIASNFKEDTSHFSCTTMLPNQNKNLFIKDFYNPQNQYPRSYGEPYKYKTTAAGFAWYQWEEKGGLPYFIIESIPEHIEKEVNPIFEVKHKEQLENHKSIICAVLYHRYQEETNMLGILNIVSDIEKFFYPDKYKRLQPLLLPYIQVIVFCYLIDQLLSSFDIPKIFQKRRGT